MISLNNRLQYYVPGIADSEKATYDGLMPDPWTPADRENEPNAFSSLGPDGKHRPLLDIDIPMEVLESSTPGHYHLSFPTVELDWLQYRKLIRVLAESGIIEEGYWLASEAKAMTVLRLPWIKKKVDAI